MRTRVGASAPRRTDRAWRRRARRRRAWRQAASGGGGSRDLRRSLCTACPRSEGLPDLREALCLLSSHAPTHVAQVELNHLLRHGFVAAWVWVPLFCSRLSSAPALVCYCESLMLMMLSRVEATMSNA